MKIKYCKECIQPNTRPGIEFDRFGICPACNYTKKTKNIDWDARKNLLQELIKKKNSRSEYDCIIGVSGGKDSFRQALYAKTALNLKPLLVSVGNPPEMLTEIGAKNISSLINKGFDAIIINPAPETWRKLMRAAFLKFCNWGKSTEFPLFAAVPKIALSHKINLILWGENPALQLGDLRALRKNGWDGNSVQKGNTLQGGNPSWMLSLNIKKNQILQYFFPKSKFLKRGKIQIIFLGYFWKDWGLHINAEHSVCNGLEIRDLQSCKNLINRVSSLDTDWVEFNQMIKYLKYGFGQTTDLVNQKIRNGEMTRAEAIREAMKHDGKFNKKDIFSFCKYININEKTFWNTVNKFYNKKLFKKTKGNQFKPLFKIGQN